jgi:AraC family transcriptional regulator
MSTLEDAPLHSHCTVEGLPDSKSLLQTDAGRIVYDIDEARDAHIIAAHPTILVNLCYDETLTAINSDKFSTISTPKDSVIYIPKGTEVHEICEGQGEVVMFEIDDDVQDNNREFTKHAPASLQDYRSDAIDQVTGQLAKTLRNAMLLDCDVNNLLIESLMAEIQHRTLSLYSIEKSKTITNNGKLSNCIVNRVLGFIEANIGNPIALNELAQQACLSPYHFNRAFKNTTGQSPHQTVLHRRLVKARKLLAQTQVSICEIAIMTGFSSQSHLTSIFTKNFQTTPKQFREQASR